MDTLTTKETVLAGSVLGASLAVFAIIGLAIGVISIIAGWRIFTKAGEKGWKILIPIYNAYILFKIIGMHFWYWFIASLALSFCQSLFGGLVMTTDAAGNLLTYDMNPFGWVCAVASGILSLVMYILICARLAKAFKKGAGFAVGLFFLSFIFEIILAFGPAKYDKKAVLKD